MRVAASVVLVASLAHAGDLTIRQRTTTTGSGRSDVREETQYAHGDLLVIDAADTRTIVDVAARTMTIADKSTRRYFVMTFDDLRRQAEAVQERARRMPPEVRKMLDEMLGDGASVTLSPTGRRETIAGQRAAEYTLSGGPFRGTLWTTDSIVLPESVRRWRELSAAATAPGAPGRPLAQALAQARGVPLRTAMTTTLGPAALSIATEVLEVRTAPVPPDVLALPAGFTRVDPPGLD
jgi:hypothetical protein